MELKVMRLQMNEQGRIWTSGSKASTTFRKVLQKVMVH